MKQLLKLVNAELTAKLALFALLASAIVVTGANAIDTGIESQDRTHLEHQLWLEENTDPASEDDMSWEEYEASQQAKEAAHANKVIAAAYGREL
ncbi:hypothetical protein [Psychrobacter sp. Marseille-P5312]|uniref:hypothetical protein n=1 Tax=Psychrobacter sp. Marseille-P5312 TaxID=2086574 RepID=UPI000CF6B5B8|nr:hypothetical protein [Psychrobacter sp. Marseille-P5312]